MAWLALLFIVVAFGGMALAFGRSERAEERRILERAEAVLARGATSYVVAEHGDDVARRAPSDPEPGAAVAPRAAPGCGPDDRDDPVGVRAARVRSVA